MECMATTVAIKNPAGPTLLYYSAIIPKVLGTKGRAGFLVSTVRPSLPLRTRKSYKVHFLAPYDKGSALPRLSTLETLMALGELREAVGRA